MKEKNVKRTQEKGITLIALVVTIVVLLILAGVSITFVLSDGGIFSKANRAKEQTEIAALREKIDNARISYITDKVADSSLTIDNLWDRLIIADIIATKDDVEGPVVEENNNIYTLNTKDGYTVEIIVNETRIPEIGDIVKGTLPPVIRKIEVSTTDTSIKAKATVSRLKSGSVEFWCKISTENDSEYKKLENISNEEAQILLTPAEGVTYKIKAVAKNDAGEHTDYSEITIGLKVKRITLDKTSVAVVPNGTLQLTPTITPQNAENQKVTWSSSDKEVATVNENGLVTVKTNGSAVITASTTDGSNLQATCNIVVKIAVESVNLNIASTQIKPNETTTLIATVNPTNATNPNVTWSVTSGSSYISLNSITGVVTGVAEGTATITVTSVDDATQKAICTVTVSEEENWEEIAKWAEQIAKDSTVDRNSEFATVNLTGGGTKKITVGETFKVKVGSTFREVIVLGFNHDELVTKYDGTANNAENPEDRQRAGISFQFKNFITDVGVPMNVSNFNTNGWGGNPVETGECYGRKYLEGSQGIKQLSSTLQSSIKQVKKKYLLGDQSSTVLESNDKLWLLSCSEIFSGPSTYSTVTDGYGYAIGYEGDRYKYYINLSATDTNGHGGLLKKKNDGKGDDQPYYWWLRSPGFDDGRNFCCISHNGYSMRMPADMSQYISPGFCI